MLVIYAGKVFNSQQKCSETSVKRIDWLGGDRATQLQKKTMLVQFDNHPHGSRGTWNLWPKQKHLWKTHHDSLLIAKDSAMYSYVMFLSTHVSFDNYFVTSFPYFRLVVCLKPPFSPCNVLCLAGGVHMSTNASTTFTGTRQVGLRGEVGNACARLTSGVYHTPVSGKDPPEGPTPRIITLIFMFRYILKLFLGGYPSYFCSTILVVVVESNSLTLSRSGLWGS